MNWFNPVSKISWILAGVGMAMAVNTASAATTTGTFAVKATIAKNCVIDSSSVSLLDFGNYDPLSATPLDTAQGNIVVRCTKNTTFDIGLNAGIGAGATVATRKMNNGTDNLNYSLFTTAARTTVWGNTVGTDTVTGTGTGLGAAQTVSKTVFGRVLAGQDVSAGTYNDTITVTVTF